MTKAEQAAARKAKDLAAAEAKKAKAVEAQLAKEAKAAEKARAAAAKKAGGNAAAKNTETRHISELGTKDREKLEELLRLDQSALSEGDLAHLAARAPYLTADERAKYGV